MLFLKKKKVLVIDLFDNSFVDIHSHLLPGIDDGAKNVEISTSLLQQLSELGIKHFVITPHVLGEVYPNTTETIQDKLRLLKEEISKTKLKDISISAAAEYMMDERFQERLKDNDILTLKEHFVLVEMSYLNPPLNLYEIIFDIQVKGFKPVLAHPERYNFYHNDFENYYKLKKAGCLFQMNLLSLSSHYGSNVKNIALKLLENNLYDFVGTDTHHLNHVKLLQILSIEKKYAEKVKLLIENNKQFL